MRYRYVHEALASDDERPTARVPVHPYQRCVMCSGSGEFKLTAETARECGYCGGAGYLARVKKERDT